MDRSHGLENSGPHDLMLKEDFPLNSLAAAFLKRTTPKTRGDLMNGALVSVGARHWKRKRPESVVLKQALLSAMLSPLDGPK
jgi:hypothetical protein